jgi:hypothetical protein
MSEDDDEDGSDDVGHVSRILSELANAVAAENIAVKLQNGRQIVGPIEGFSVRKKTNKKGNVSWSGNLRVQTDPGVLQIDCMTIDAIEPK